MAPAYELKSVQTLLALASRAEGAVVLVLWFAEEQAEARTPPPTKATTAASVAIRCLEAGVVGMGCTSTLETPVMSDFGLSVATRKSPVMAI